MKVTSNSVVDKVMNQKRFDRVSQRRDMPSSHENSTGMELLKNSVGRESIGSPCGEYSAVELRL